MLVTPSAHQHRDHALVPYSYTGNNNNILFTVIGIVIIYNLLTISAKT